MLGDALEWLKLTEVVVGLIIGLITSGVGVFLWWDRRNRQYVDSRTSTVEVSSARVVERLEQLEDHVARVDRDVASIKDHLANLPTARDMTELKVAMGEQRATLQQTNGMVQTLYKAAFMASGGKQ